MSDNKFEQKYHEYDGIVEHNNPMPRWWTWSFVATIIFAAAYYYHYEISGKGATLQDELKASMQQLEVVKHAAKTNNKQLTNEDLLAMAKDPKIIQGGGVVYTGKCAMCHGDQLEGKIGPNLTDATWIHGSQPTEILKVVHEGVAAKGMPQWDGVLTAEEIDQVVAFIISKRL